MTKRSSKLEYEERVNDVISQILKGTTKTGDLLHFITQKYDIKDRQSKEYIATAREQIGSLMSDWEKNQQIQLSLARYNALFKECYENGDYSGARQAQTRIDKLLGLEEPEKKYITSDSDTGVVIYLPDNGRD